MGARVRCTAAVAAAVVVCLLFLALREDSKLIAQEEGHNAHAGPGTNLNSAQGLLTIASREKQEEALVKPSPEASAPDPDAQKMASPGSGVILYSYGRSATDTFANTIRTAAGWEYCNGRKEGFKESHVQGQGKTDLSQHALQKCLDSGQRLTHLKPWHSFHSIHTDPFRTEIASLRDELEQLGGVGGEEVLEKIERLEPIDGVEDFFAAAKRAGFGHVIISFRENMLASMVSSWELTCTERKKCKKNMKGTFEEEDLLKKNVHALEIDYAMYFAEMVELYARGVIAALDEGLNVIPFTFEEVTSDLCGSVNRFFEEIGEEPKNECAEKIGHTGTIKGDKKEMTLEDRVGKKLAKKVKKNLENTMHEWMLGLGVTELTFREQVEEWREEVPLFWVAMARVYGWEGGDAEKWEEETAGWVEGGQMARYGPGTGWDRTREMPSANEWGGGIGV